MTVQQKLESMASLRNLLWNSTAPITIRTLVKSDAIVNEDLTLTENHIKIYSIL